MAQGSRQFPGPRLVVQLNQGAFWPYRSALTDDLNFKGVGAWVGFESSISHAGSLGQAGTYLVAFVPKSPGVRTVETKTESPQWGQERAEEASGGGPGGQHSAAGSSASMGRAISQLHRADGVREAEGAGRRSGEIDLLWRIPIPESKARDWGLPTFPMEWIAVPVFWLSALVLPDGAELRGRRSSCSPIITKAALLPAHASRACSSMKAMQALQPQVNALRSSTRAIRQRVSSETHGALPPASGEPAGRLSAHGGADPGLLRALRRAVGVGRVQNAPVHLLRASADGSCSAVRSLDLRPRRRTTTRISCPS